MWEHQGHAKSSTGAQLFNRFLAGVLGGEGDVSRVMPVLHDYHVLERLRELVVDWHDLAALFDREATAGHAGVLPARIVLGHVHDQVGDMTHDAGSARAAPVGEVPLLGNQAPMPPQQVSGEMVSSSSKALRHTACGAGEQREPDEDSGHDER